MEWEIGALVWDLGPWWGTLGTGVGTWSPGWGLGLLEDKVGAQTHAQGRFIENRCAQFH